MRGPNLIAWAVALEALLGVVGVAIAQWAGTPIRDQVELSAASLARGVAALTLMLLMLGALMRSSWGPIVELRRQVTMLVEQMFGDAPWPALLAVAVAAGVGEELLFRGGLQPLAVRWTGPVAGVTLVSVVFGLLHAVSWAYFIAATAIGLLLGWLAEAYQDLTAPIFAHAVYDFVALVALRSRGRTPADQPAYSPNTTGQRDE
jgi:membrane protease YdiL (CAAX protease family)